MAALNADVVGEIMCWISWPKTPQQAHTLAAVCHRWHEAFHCSEMLWQLLMQARYPTSRPTAWRSSVYRARVLGARATVVPATTLHLIEDCAEAEALCPAYAEELVPMPGGNNLWCPMCKEEVFIVRSQEALLQRRAEGRCVFFSIKDMTPRTVVSTSAAEKVLIVLVADNDADERTALQRILAESHCTQRAVAFRTVVADTAARFFFESPTLELVFRTARITYAPGQRDGAFTYAGPRMPMLLFIMSQGIAPSEALRMASNCGVVRPYGKHNPGHSPIFDEVMTRIYYRRFSDVRIG